MPLIRPTCYKILGTVPILGFILLSAMAALLMSCASSDKIRHDEMQQRLNLIATQKFGSQFDFVANSTHEYFLCIKRQKERAAVQAVHFFLYDSIKDSVVYERELDNGSVHWLNASQLSIERIPGNVTGDEEPTAFIELYDVIAGTISIPKASTR